MRWLREIISHAYEIWIWFHIPWNQSWFHIWNMDMISWFHIVWFHVLYMHAYMIGLTMISWVWFHTWNYDIIGNLKSYVMVSRNHIPCIWFQWYDFIYLEIMMWFHIWNLVDLNLCPPICPNIPYAEIYVTIPNVDGAEPMIMRQHVLDEEVKENQGRRRLFWSWKLFWGAERPSSPKSAVSLALLYVTIRDYSASKSTARKVKVITNKHANVYSFNPHGRGAGHCDS